eukprot:CAMPEP_0119014060 /NCGR_PEP_ID=MMETSP1176-20130426/9331_1 /TAXON_ID=265551 /ORGANISM="Synedropsis recta cf, Strain CCMP1620" /LENGTH=541 /DNA_ID=CAMNT_0006967197 /DNA_START=192 /DNA_END=1817 /DNA_ORIENTATION=+
MQWTIICFVLAIASYKSEAFATSFTPSFTRGGATIGPAFGAANSDAAASVNFSKNEANDVNGQAKDDDIDNVMEATFVAETNLPSDLGDFRLRAYRTAQGSNPFAGNEPCVIYSADKPPFGEDGKLKESVPVRVHDQCLTSEVFGSNRCDCKEQLRMALEYVKENGGAVIYLQQEGRGIGLANKIAAYALQDGGMDTVDANLHLGFPEDNRQYGVIASILKDMKINSIQLMTNNPLKVDRLTSLGISVEKTVPVVVQRANEHNIRYLETKKERMNHSGLSDMLSRDLDPLVSNDQNGLMAPKKVLEHGETAAANAVQVSLGMDGVTASNDGYCFGRKSVEDAIAAVARGDMVCVVDDMDRENEGDLIMASDLCTPEMMAKIIRYSSGVICCAMEGDRMDELQLPPMVVNNEDPKETAFAVSVDAVKEQGITTGISARDRAVTVQLLANAKATPGDFSRPGHIFPLRAKAGGVLERDGHTEATVDISRMAGLSPCGVLCEIVSEENPTEMARLPELVRFCETHDMVLTSIVDMQQYRRDTEQ